jgi:hypothetical protein
MSLPERIIFYGCIAFSAMLVYLIVVGLLEIFT